MYVCMYVCLYVCINEYLFIFVPDLTKAVGICLNVYMVCRLLWSREREGCLCGRRGWILLTNSSTTTAFH